MTDVTATGARPPLDPHAAKIMIGSTWSRTFQTFRATPWKYVALVLIPYPFAVVGGILQFALGKQAAVIPVIVLSFAQYFFQFVGQSASVYGASRSLSGAGWTLSESIGVGIRRFFPLLGLGLLIVLPLIAIGIALAFMGRVGVIVGLVLIIPILMALAAVMLSQQACVIESKGPVESIKRSEFLSRNNRWRLIGFVLLLVLLPLLVLGVVYVAGAFIVAGLHSAVVSIVAVILAFVTLIPAVIAYQAIITIAFAVAFCELRTLKEGNAPQDRVSRVFD